jgi:cobalamin biosynthesis Mg chelatase CobN
MHSARARHLAPAAAVLLLTLFTVGLLAGTGSAHVGRLAAAVTTSTTATAEDTATAETTSTETTTEETSTETTTAETPATTTIELTTPGSTTVTSISPGGAVVVGAAAASQQQDDSDTQWGWIAFGILAAAVVIFGIVWFVRRPRHATP